MKLFLNLFIALFGFGPDIINVTAGTVGNAGNVAASLITYLSQKMLDVAEFNTILDQFGDKVPLPSNNSLTIRFVREEKLSVATTPTQLTQGVPPDAVGITLNQFEATVEQYGNVVRISDLAELTAKHPIVSTTVSRLGLQAAETYDQLVYNVLDAATNVYRPNSKAGDTSLVASDKVSYVDLVQLSALMSEQGAKPMDGGDYAFICAPQVFAGLQNDPDWKAAHQFTNTEAIYRGEVGALSGFRVIRSNSPSFAVTAQAGSGQSNKVYSSFAIGRSAFQITDLQNVQMYMTEPGGHTDPLHQSRLMGWKFAFKSLITNQSWIRRVRSAGASSVTNP